MRIKATIQGKYSRNESASSDDPALVDSDADGSDLDGEDAEHGDNEGAQADVFMPDRRSTSTVERPGSYTRSLGNLALCSCSAVLEAHVQQIKAMAATRTALKKNGSGTMRAWPDERQCTDQHKAIYSVLSVSTGSVLRTYTAP